MGKADQPTKNPLCSGFLRVPKEGFEPSRGNPHYALNVARLPIPPLRQAHLASRRISGRCGQGAGSAGTSASGVYFIPNDCFVNHCVTGIGGATQILSQNQQSLHTGFTSLKFAAFLSVDQAAEFAKLIGIILSDLQKDGTFLLQFR